MKSRVLSWMMAGAMCSVATIAFAGAYGEAEETTEAPAPAPAPAAAVVEEVKKELGPIRRWEGFATDAETSRGLWVEIGTFYAQEDDFDIGDISTTQLRLAYGGRLWEVGTEISYDYLGFDGHLDTDADLVDDFSDEVDGISDLDLWAKLVPLRTKHATLGLGMVVTFPTGNDGLHGTRTPVWNLPGQQDEYGFNIFMTSGLQMGPVHFRASLGYQAYTDVDQYDKVDYNVGILIPIGDMIVVRTELQGYNLVDDEYPDPNDYVDDFYLEYYGPNRSDVNDPVAVLPGVDIRLAMGGGELLIRPTGMVGLTSEAGDWGVGVSVAFTGIGG